MFVLYEFWLAFAQSATNSIMFIKVLIGIPIHTLSIIQVGFHKVIPPLSHESGNKSSELNMI